MPFWVQTKLLPYTATKPASFSGASRLGRTTPGALFVCVWGLLVHLGRTPGHGSLPVSHCGNLSVQCCATLSLSLLLHSVESRPLSDDDAEPSPEIEDPGRPFRRLIQAILLASLQDYVGSQDRQTFLEARCFLFPESTDKKEHLARLLECSGLDAGWFRERCEQLRLRAVAPEVQAASASRNAVKRRVRERCRQAF